MLVVLQLQLPGAEGASRFAHMEPGVPPSRCAHSLFKVCTSKDLLYRLVYSGQVSHLRLFVKVFLVGFGESGGNSGFRG